MKSLGNSSPKAANVRMPEEDAGQLQVPPSSSTTHVLPSGCVDQIPHVILTALQQAKLSDTAPKLLGSETVRKVSNSLACIV